MDTARKYEQVNRKEDVFLLQASVSLPCPLLTEINRKPKTPWRRKRPPTPVFLPGKSHGQRSLEGYSPRGRKESDTAEQLTLSLSLSLPPENWFAEYHLQP